MISDVDLGGWGEVQGHVLIGGEKVELDELNVVSVGVDLFGEVVATVIHEGELMVLKLVED